MSSFVRGGWGTSFESFHRPTNVSHGRMTLIRYSSCHSSSSSPKPYQPTSAAATDDENMQEDPWNSIMSGAATGGILAARAGPRAMASAAVVGGVILALIEGMGIWMNNYFSMPPQGMEGECYLDSVGFGMRNRGDLVYLC